MPMSFELYFWIVIYFWIILYLSQLFTHLTGLCSTATRLRVLYFSAVHASFTSSRCFSCLGRSPIFYGLVEALSMRQTCYVVEIREGVATVAVIWCTWIFFFRASPHSLPRRRVRMQLVNLLLFTHIILWLWFTLSTVLRREHGSWQV